MQAHWQDVYTTKSENSVSWYKDHLAVSIDMIKKARTALGKNEKQIKIIDIGGGASTLTDDLLALGFEHITVVDISVAALNKTKLRLEQSQVPHSNVQFVACDMSAPWSVLKSETFDIWHDRAVFHFFVTEEARSVYKQNLQNHLAAHGHVIMATFRDPDGPSLCSNLPTRRYNASSMVQELEDKYELLEEQVDVHVTPKSTSQVFQYCHLAKK